MFFATSSSPKLSGTVPAMLRQISALKRQIPALCRQDRAACRRDPAWLQRGLGVGALVRTANSWSPSPRRVLLGAKKSDGAGFPFPGEECARLWRRAQAHTIELTV